MQGWFFLSFKRSNYLTENVKTLFVLMWEQCTDIMRQNIEALDTFDTISSAGDGLSLLKAIKDMAYNFQSQKYLPHSLHESNRRIYLCAQGWFATTQVCLEQFQNLVDVIEHSGRSVRHDPGIKKILATEQGKNLSTMTSFMREEIKRDSHGWYPLLLLF